jgi:hypothetical protein
MCCCVDLIHRFVLAVEFEGFREAVAKTD